MWRVLAVVQLTFRESVRRRVFLGLAFFAALLIGLAVSLPAIDAESKIRLIQSWCLRTISFFGVLIAVFLSATSIPDDIEARKLYLVVTKPVTRFQTLAGKLLGFCLVLLVFLAAMGTLSVGYVRWLDGSLFGAGQGFLETRERIEANAFGLVHEEGKPGWTTCLLSENEPPRLWINRAPESRLFWSFQGVGALPIGDRIRAELTVYASCIDASYAGDGTITIVRAGSLEYKRLEKQRLMWNVPHRFEIPRRLIDDRGVLEIGVAPANSRSAIGAAPGSLVLFTEPISLGFERNFAKSLLATYAQLVMITTMTTMGSTAVSGPVSIFLGLFLFLTGSLVSFVRQSMPTVVSTIRSVTTRTEAGHYHPDPDDLPLWLLQFSQAVSDSVVRVIPDLSLYDTPENVLEGISIPFGHVLDLCGYAGVYVGAAFLLGWMFFSMREMK